MVEESIASLKVNAIPLLRATPVRLLDGSVDTTLGFVEEELLFLQLRIDTTASIASNEKILIDFI